MWIAKNILRWSGVTGLPVSHSVYISWTKGRLPTHISERKRKFDFGTFICSFVLSELGHITFQLSDKVDLWIIWSSFYETSRHKIDKWLIQTPVRRPWIENNSGIISEQQYNGRAVPPTPNYSASSAMLWQKNSEGVIRTDTKPATKKIIKKTIWNIDLFPPLLTTDLSLSPNVPWNVA